MAFHDISGLDIYLKDKLPHEISILESWFYYLVGRDRHDPDASSHTNLVSHIPLDAHPYMGNVSNKDSAQLRQFILDNHLIEVAFEITSFLQHTHNLSISATVHTFFFELSSSARNFRPWAKFYSNPKNSSFGSPASLFMTATHQRVQFFGKDTSWSVLDYTSPPTVSTWKTPLVRNRCFQIIPVFLEYALDRCSGMWLEMLDTEGWYIVQKYLSEHEPAEHLLKDIVFEILYGLEIYSDKSHSLYQHFNTWFESTYSKYPLVDWRRHIQTTSQILEIPLSVESFARIQSTLSTEPLNCVEECIYSV